MKELKDIMVSILLTAWVLWSVMLFMTSSCQASTELQIPVASCLPKSAVHCLLMITACTERLTTNSMWRVWTSPPVRTAMNAVRKVWISAIYSKVSDSSFRSKKSGISQILGVIVCWTNKYGNYVMEYYINFLFYSTLFSSPAYGTF